MSAPNSFLQLSISSHIGIVFSTLRSLAFKNLHKINVNKIRLNIWPQDIRTQYAGAENKQQCNCKQSLKKIGRENQNMFKDATSSNNTASSSIFPMKTVIAT